MVKSGVFENIVVIFEVFPHRETMCEQDIHFMIKAR